MKFFGGSFHVFALNLFGSSPLVGISSPELDKVAGALTALLALLVFRRGNSHCRKAKCVDIIVAANEHK